MKKIYTLVLIVLSNQMTAQTSIGTSYRLGLPQQGMRQNMGAVHNFYMDVLRTIPQAKQLSFGAEMGIGNYAMLREPMTFSFGNGYPTTTNVNYSSNTAAINGILQYDLLRKSNITPYVQAKLGVQAMYSRIFVEDPNDIDGCAPLENKLIDNDCTFTYGGTVGLRFALNSKHGIKHAIDFGVGYMQGGYVDYVNTKRLKNHDDPTLPQAPAAGEAGKPVNMNFINVQSNVIHAHKVGELYTDRYKMMEVKLSYIFVIK